MVAYVSLYRGCLFFFFKQKTAYEMRISDWSSDVCSSDLLVGLGDGLGVDQGLAVEAELLALAALRGKALGVVEVEMHAVDDSDAMGARGEDAEAEAGQYREPVRRVGRLQVLHQVGGAHDQADDPWRGARHCRGIPHAERRFPHALDAPGPRHRAAE